MACRYRLMPDGRRQILTILIPGDFFDLHGFLLQVTDHSVAAIGPTRIAAIGREAVIDIIANHPRIGAALWWSAMQEDAMLRERIVALGRRSARGRVAYLLCELVWRQRAIGMAEDHAIHLPFTQTDLADMLGLTSVHTNRILQGFRQDGLIAAKSSGRCCPGSRGSSSHRTLRWREPDSNLRSRRRKFRRFARRRTHERVTGHALSSQNGSSRTMS